MFFLLAPKWFIPVPLSCFFSSLSACLSAFSLIIQPFYWQALHLFPTWLPKSAIKKQHRFAPVLLFSPGYRCWCWSACHPRTRAVVESLVVVCARCLPLASASQWTNRRSHVQVAVSVSWLPIETTIPLLSFFSLLSILFLSQLPYHPVVLPFCPYLFCLDPSGASLKRWSNASLVRYAGWTEPPTHTTLTRLPPTTLDPSTIRHRCRCRRRSMSSVTQRSKLSSSNSSSSSKDTTTCTTHIQVIGLVLEPHVVQTRNRSITDELR